MEEEMVEGEKKVEEEKEALILLIRPGAQAPGTKADLERDGLLVIEAHAVNLAFTVHRVRRFARVMRGITARTCHPGQ